MGKISSELEAAEMKKQTLRKTLEQIHSSSSSFLLFSLQWKDLEDHFDTARRFLLEQVQGLESKEKRVEELSRGFEAKEERLRECLKEFDLKEVNLEERVREVESREVRIEGCSRDFEVKEKRYGECIRKLEAKEKRLGECLKELELKEKKIEELSKELELRRERFEECWGGLGAKEEQYAERIRELEVKEDGLKESWKELEEWNQVFELRDKKIEERFRELETKEKQFEARFKELELREESIELRLKDIGLKEKRSEEIILNENKLGEGIKELELKEKLFEKRIKELELREKRFADSLHTRVKTEPLEDFPVNNVVNNFSTASLRFCVTMDGKSLQIFLNERWKEHDSMRLEVATALRLSSDPAKLVLDAMEGFYPPRLKKGDVEFDESIVQGSCVLLLEQLLKLSPSIKPDVKQEAMRLAIEWRVKMRVDTQHSLEVLGFLQLLASYGLASAFDADELIMYLEKVSEYEQLPGLCQILGVDNKVPGLIQNLIKRKQLPGAIRLIYVFKLADKFPPRDLLKDCLKCSNNSSESFFKKKNRSPKAQVSFQNFKSSITFLKKRKRKAMKKKTKLTLGSKKHIAPVTPAAAPIPAPTPTSITENNLTCPATIAKTTGHAPAPLTPVQQHSGSKRPWIAVSADAAPNTSKGSTSTAHLIELPHQEPASLFSNKVSCTVHSHVKSGQLSKESSPLDSREASLAVNPQQDPKCSSVSEDGEILRSLLNNQVEYDSMRSKVSDALQSVPDPDKLVLDAIKGIYPSNLKGDEGFKLGVSRNFILLLKQLIGVSPQIKPLVKVEATKFANDWKSRLKKKRDDPLEVLAFLQFLVAYGLASSFYANEVLRLLDTDVWRKKVPDLCRVLGLTDIMPNFIQNHIKEDQQLEAIKYICALELADNFPLVTLLNDHFKNSKRKVEDLCQEGNKSLPVQLKGISKDLTALRAVLSWIEIYKLEDENFREILEKHIVEQEKQQAEKKHEYDSSNVKNGPRTRSKVTLLQQHQQQQSGSPKTLGSEMDPQQTNQVRPQHTEQMCIATTTMITATTAPSSLTSGNTPKSEPQEHSGRKRRRTEVPREAPPIYAVGATSAFHSVQPPNWHPPGLFMDQDAPYFDTSARHYSLSGHPLPNVHMNQYVYPDYPRDALRRPVYYDRIPGYYDRPICDPADTIRGPGLYNYPMPYGGYNLPP